MAIAGLGLPEIIVILIVILIIVGPPILVILLILYLIKRNKNSQPRMKKCPFCAYSLPVEAIVCRFCGREVAR